MREYLVKNKQNNKYYNFITKQWTTYPTYACLILNKEQARELVNIEDIEILTVSKLITKESIVDEVLSLV